MKDYGKDSLLFVSTRSGIGQQKLGFNWKINFELIERLEYEQLIRYAVKLFYSYGKKLYRGDVTG